jgi:tol-pal system protein YbgF
MKKNISPKYCFKKTYILILMSVLFSYSSLTMPRTLIFQSDSEKGSGSQAVEVLGVARNDTSTSSSSNSSSAPLVSNNAVSATGVASSANSELFFMIEQLQQEVNTLRGLLEEQSYELRMFKQSGKDRYQDLDTRILDITKRLSKGSIANSAERPSQYAQTLTGSTISTSLPSSVELIPVKVVPVVLAKQREPTAAENEDYQKAYELIKEKKFDESIIALFSYTENYPESPLLPNVYYWLGEVYLAMSKLDQAKTSFSLVNSAYSGSQKAADSLYKLAVTVDRLGDTDLARQYINDVKLKYPESTAAKLAASYKIIE